jgi:hypothetical protein
MSKARKILGYLSLFAGCVCLFVGLSPLFPIIIEAYLMAAVFFGLGIWALTGKGIRDFFRMASEAARAVRRKGKEEPSTRIDPLLPVRILKLAREREGHLTVSEVAISLNVPIDQAEEGLKACVRSGNALADYDITHGFAQYSFPEYTSPEDRKRLLG